MGGKVRMGCGTWQLCAMLRHNGQRWRLYQAIVEGDWRSVEQIPPKLLTKAIFFPTRLTPLHVAALTGQVEIVALLLDKAGANVNCATCSGGQTPLTLASKSGKHECVEYLIQRGGNVLLLDTSHSRSCLHYAAKAGHVECVRRILCAAKSSPASSDESWKFVRFVNLRDSNGVTALHLAARGGCLGAVQLLLHNGALVTATTSASSNGAAHGSTPLHFAARSGSVESVKELLAWGADRNQRDVTGYTAYGIARKHKSSACAALLDPNVTEPLVWPSPCKFMNSLEPATKKLLEDALHKANRTRCAQQQHGEAHSVCDLDEDMKACSICLEHCCDIKLQDCGHEICGVCIVTLCCHNKPNPALPFSPPPVCPFCRRMISLIEKI